MNQEFIGALKEIVKDKGIRREGLTRSASIWRASDIRSWAMPYTVRQNVRTSFRDRRCMRGSSALCIRGQGNIWNFRRRFRSILRSFCGSCPDNGS